MIAKRCSLKQHLLRLFLMAVAISVSLLIFLLYIASENSRTRLARSAESNLELFAMTLTSQMNSVESYMLETSHNEERFHRLADSNDETQAYSDVYEIRQTFPAVLAANELVMGLVLNVSPGGVCAGSYNDVFETTMERLIRRRTLEEYLQTWMGVSSIPTTDWYTERIGGKVYLLRRMAYGNVVLTAAFDLEQVFDVSRLGFDESEKILVYDGDGNLLIGDPDYDKVEEICASRNGYQTLHVQGQSMMVARQEIANLTVYQLVPYQGTGMEFGNIWILLMVATLVVMLALPFLWYYLQRVVFKPLNRLVGTMERIGGGELSARPTEDDYNIEFAQVNETFNRMIEQITQLKIDQYERQLEAERNKLAMLKMQIRPHFILNCMKSVYALAETGQTSDVQTLILSLSGYLRYILSFTQETIPLREEVAQCCNYVMRIKNSVFGGYNPYTTLVYGDWYFAVPDKHTGCVFLNDQALYETANLEACIRGEAYACSWEPEASVYKWYTEQDAAAGETVIYANFHGKDPNREKVEFTVRRECFLPKEEDVGYITVSGFNINKAATTWAPPAAYQDGMIGPHWSIGWIIEDCEIWGSRCAGISLGRYFDPDNSNYFTTKYTKSPTQMERDAVCRGQYYGWLKERIGSHIIRRCNIHHCEQGGIIGRMGGAFSLIEDNHIHHINNMMELGGAEIAGIKLHAAIDVVMRCNHIHHCTMGIWCDWEAQGTRITANLLHDNQRPAFATQLKGGMMSQDLFVEVGHGPTLIDNNVLLSDVSLRFATEGVALVHNLICGAFTCVGGGTGPRYTPYHIAHRTEVMGFMTVLHGDDRIYNNIFVQKWPSEPFKILRDCTEGFDTEERKVGTFAFDAYPTYEEWHALFVFDGFPDMMGLMPAQEGHLPVWINGNAYFNGARGWKKERHALHCADAVHVDLRKKADGWYLDTNVYDFLEGYQGERIDTNLLGKAFEPEEAFENPDGTPIVFDRDYFGSYRGVEILPGPFTAHGTIASSNLCKLRRNVELSEDWKSETVGERSLNPAEYQAYPGKVSST